MKLSAFLRFSLLAIGGTACVAPGHVLLHLPSAVNNHQLPPLEPEVEVGALTSTSPDDLLLLFQNEIYRNVAEPTASATVGTARLLVTEAQLKRTGRALQIIQLSTLLTPTLLAIPLETYQASLTARVQIRDGQGKVLGEYEGRGQAKARVAMYYGFSQHEAPGVADALALRMALAQIRQQLDSAAARLTPLLLAPPAVTADGLRSAASDIPDVR
jgi:hypothetical protein